MCESEASRSGDRQGNEDLEAGLDTFRTTAILGA